MSWQKILFNVELDGVLAVARHRHYEDKDLYIAEVYIDGVLRKRMEVDAGEEAVVLASKWFQQVTIELGKPGKDYFVGMGIPIP